MISSIYRNVNDSKAIPAVCATRKRAGRKVTKPNHDAQFKSNTTERFWTNYSKNINEKLRTRS